MTYQYGLLLPHFGEFSSAQKTVEAACEAERYGFDSVWLRDHLIWHPHGMEGEDRTFFEPMTSLAVIGSQTRRVAMGMGSLIPHRHPLYLAQQYATLSHYVGPNRLIAGFGIGGFAHEFDAIGLGGIPRHELLEEQVAVMRKAWSGEVVDHQGTFYQFTNVDIHPSPVGDIPIWYCGNSKAAARRAVEYCQGWLPGRIDLKTFSLRLERMQRLAEEAGKPVPTAGSIPIVSPGRSREEALKKVNMAGMLEAMNHSRDLEKPESGEFRTADDMRGALIAGTPEQIVEQVREAQAVGNEVLVFDLRFRFDEWDECARMLGEDVLPALRRGDR